MKTKTLRMFFTKYIVRGVALIYLSMLLLNFCIDSFQEQTTVPSQSILLEKSAYDYVDSYKDDLALDVTPTEVTKAFFTSSPKWVEHLFHLRNTLVGVLGLKTPDDNQDSQKALENFRCEVGDQVGFFKVFKKTENEIILGANDSHLDFRVSILNDSNNKDLYFSTTVTYHNRLGRLYFWFVKPFHKLIVPSMLEATIDKLEVK